MSVTYKKNDFATSRGEALPSTNGNHVVAWDRKEKPNSDPEPLAETITKISEGMDRLLKSGLNRKAIIVLLADCTAVSRRDIKLVLDGLNDLAAHYVLDGGFPSKTKKVKP